MAKPIDDGNGESHEDIDALTAGLIKPQDRGVQLSQPPMAWQPTKEGHDATL